MTEMLFQLVRNSLKSPGFIRSPLAFSTSQQLHEKNSPPEVSKIGLQILQNSEGLEHNERPRNELITVNVPMNISKISGVPEEHIKGRRIRIYKFSKNAMQSGTNNVGVWNLDFDTHQRWENPLMGWTSTGDPLSNMKVQFTDVEDAIQFAEKNGWEWYLDIDSQITSKVKSYGFNFSWNKRSRVSTK